MSRSREDIEFEKNRKEILRQSKTSLKSKSTSSDKKINLDNSHRYAWEYEVEVYKEQKKKERFFHIGAWCGIISLLLTLFFNYKHIVELLPFK